MVCSTCTTAFHELCSKYGLVTLCALPSVRTGVISVYLYYDLEEHTVYFWSSGMQKKSIVTYLVLEERQWLCLAHFLLTTCPLERHALILKSFKGLTCVSSGFWHLSYCNFVVQQSTVLEKQKVWPYLLWLETSTKSESWWCELMPSSYNNFNIFRKNRYNFRQKFDRFKISISVYSKISKVTDGNQACLGRARVLALTACRGGFLSI